MDFRAKTDIRTGSLLKFLEMAYLQAIFAVKGKSANPLKALFLEFMRGFLLLLMFYLMFELLGIRSGGGAIRGNVLLFLITGVFCYRTHVKVISDIAGTVNPFADFKLGHTTMLLSIFSASLGSLYTTSAIFMIILLGCHLFFERIEIFDPKIFAYAFFLAWFSGVGGGILFGALTQFFPRASNVIRVVYIRAMIIFSGKMFLANTMPAFLLPYYLWNPLFHAIDQCRGGAFINYDPRVTSLDYPLYFTLGLIFIGFLIAHMARRYVSRSWKARA